MARRKSTRSVEAEEAAFEAELEQGQTLPNRIDLRKKAKERPKKPGERDPVETAEAALQEMSASFGDWMHGELEAMLDCWTRASADGYAEDSRAALFRCAHDMKGQAATLGFPMVGLAAASLADLLLDGPDSVRLPQRLVDQHVQAIRAMVREGARDDHATARALAEKLAMVTRDYLAKVDQAA